MFEMIKVIVLYKNLLDRPNGHWSQFNHLMSWQGHIWTDNKPGFSWKVGKYLSSQYVDNYNGFALVSSSNFFCIYQQGRSITNTSTFFSWGYFLSIYLNSTPSPPPISLFLRKIKIRRCRSWQKAMVVKKLSRGLGVIHLSCADSLHLLPTPLPTL